MPNQAFFQTLERQHSSELGGDSILDPGVIGTLLELGGEEPSELIVELVDLYLDDADVRLDDMHSACTRGDVQAMGSVAHALKSASANIGAVSFSRLCREIETSARSGAAADELSDPIGRFDSMLGEVRAALDQLRRSCQD